MSDPRHRQSPPEPAESESEIVELIRSIDVRAPDSLHDAVDAMIAERSSASKHFARGERAATHERPRRRRRAASTSPALSRSRGGARLAAVGSIAAAIVALVIVVSLGGSSSTLSVHDASALTLRAATTAAPRESPASRGELAAAVDGVAFPYWSAHFGWHATGQRTDEVDGRRITTVFYENEHGKRVGYAIVAGSKPPQLTGGVVSRHDGTPYRLLTVEGAAVVAWTREGHLCVISGRGVGGATLLRLASWNDGRSVSS